MILARNRSTSARNVLAAIRFQPGILSGKSPPATVVRVQVWPNPTEVSTKRRADLCKHNYRVRFEDGGPEERVFLLAAR